MARLKDFGRLRKKWLKDTSVKKVYGDLHEEFQVSAEILKARTRAKMTQLEVAKKIGTKAPAISRLESPEYGKASIAVLRKVANALDCELQVKFIPKRKRASVKSAK